MTQTSSMKKLALGCAALAAALFVIRWFTESPAASWESPTSSGLVASAATHARAGATRQALESDAKDCERAPGSVSAPAAATSAHAALETSFHGKLLDRAGQPLSGSLNPSVSLVDAEGRRRTSAEREQGGFAFSALPYGKYWLTASAEGCLKLTDEIELDAAHAQLAKDYTLAPAPILKIRVLTPAGANLFDEELQIEARPALAAIATRELPGKWIDEVAGSLGNPCGIGRFFQSGPRVDSLPGGYMGILILDQELPAFVSLINAQRVLQTQSVKAGDEVVTFVLTADELAASLAAVRMQAVDPVTLAPIRTAPTVLLGGGFVDRSLEPDPSSRLLLAAREPARFDSHSDTETADAARARIVADSSSDDARREQGRELDIEIQVVDSTGAPRNAAFTLGVYDPLTGGLKLDKQSAYVSSGAGELELLGLHHELYVLRTATDLSAAADLGDDSMWDSGNVVLDLRPRSAPTSFVITLRRATYVMLYARSDQVDGLNFRALDEQGLELEAGLFYGHSPRPLMLPQGGCKFLLLDASGQVLSEQQATVGTRPLTVVLTR